MKTNNGIVTDFYTRTTPMFKYINVFVFIIFMVIFQFPLTALSQMSSEENQTVQTNATVGLGDLDWSTINVLELKTTQQIALDSTTYWPRMNDNAGASHWWQSEIDYQDDKGYLNLFHPNVTLDIPYDTYGWDGLGEFDALQTPAGSIFIRSPYLPEPDFASPHSAEVVIGIHSVSTAGDGREVERDPFMASGLIGINYLHNDHFGVHVNFQATTNLLKGGDIPDPLIGQDEIYADDSYGAFMLDVYF